MPASAAAPSPAAAAAPVAVAPPPPIPVARFRHDFIQTPTHTTVTFYMKGATKDNCQVDFEDRSLTLDWTISSSDSWQVTFDPLFDAIVPEECTVSCFSTKVSTPCLSVSGSAAAAVLVFASVCICCQKWVAKL